MINFTGDLYIGHNLIQLEESPKVLLESGKYIISNFENVYVNSSLEMRDDKYSILTFEKDIFESYISNFVNSFVFTLGNNHMNDLGNDGITTTLNFLEKYSNVLYTGIGKSQHIKAPLILTDNGKKIALLAVSTDEPEVMAVLASEKQSGVLNMNDCVINEIITSYKKIVDVFIVIPHWGKEYIKYPSVQQRKKAYEWIDAGADIIIGHHPHIIQGKEKYKGRFIYYSLGNYIFPEFFYKHGIKHCWKSENSESILLSIDFSKGINITEYGLFFDVTKNVLKTSKNAYNNFIKRSLFLDIDKYSIKKYYGIWQKELYKLLKRDYFIGNKVSKYFPIHKDSGRFLFFFKRLINKIIRNGHN